MLKCKYYNLPLDYYSNIVYNLICNLIDFVKRNTPYSEQLREQAL